MQKTISKIYFDKLGKIEDKSLIPIRQENNAQNVLQAYFPFDGTGITAKIYIRRNDGETYTLPLGADTALTNVVIDDKPYSMAEFIIYNGGITSLYGELKCTISLRATYEVEVDDEVEEYLQINNNRMFSWSCEETSFYEPALTPEQQDHIIELQHEVGEIQQQVDEIIAKGDEIVDLGNFGSIELAVEIMKNAMSVELDGTKKVFKGATGITPFVAIIHKATSTLMGGNINHGGRIYSTSLTPSTTTITEIYAPKDNPVFSGVLKTNRIEPATPGGLVLHNPYTGISLSGGSVGFDTNEVDILCIGGNVDINVFGGYANYNGNEIATKIDLIPYATTESLNSEKQERMTADNEIIGRVELIEQRGQSYGAIPLTQEELLAMTELDRQTYLINFAIGQGAPNPLPGGILLYTNGENSHEWEYNYDTEKWVDNGISTVNTASNTVLGIVKGSLDEGKISVDSVTGEMSVNGWSDSTKFRGTWNATTTYNKNDVVIGVDNMMFLSLQDNNLNNPVNRELNTIWKNINYTSYFQYLVSDITANSFPLITTTTGTGNSYVRKNPNFRVIDSMVHDIRGKLAAMSDLHESKTTNIEIESVHYETYDGENFYPYGSAGFDANNIVNPIYLVIRSTIIGQDVIDNLIANNKLTIVANYQPKASRKKRKARYTFVYNWIRFKDPDITLTPQQIEYFTKCLNDVTIDDIVQDHNGDYRIIKKINMAEFFNRNYFFNTPLLPFNYSSLEHIESLDPNWLESFNPVRTSVIAEKYVFTTLREGLPGIFNTVLSKKYRQLGTFACNVIEYNTNAEIEIATPLLKSRTSTRYSEYGNIPPFGIIKIGGDLWQTGRSDRPISPSSSSSGGSSQYGNGFKGLSFRLSFAIKNDDYLNPHVERIFDKRFKVNKNIISIQPSFWKDNTRSNYFFTVLKYRIIK